MMGGQRDVQVSWKWECSGGPRGRGSSPALVGAVGHRWAVPHLTLAACRVVSASFLESLLLPLTFVLAEPTGVPGLFHGPRVPPPPIPAWPKGARVVYWHRVSLRLSGRPWQISEH